MELKLHKKLLKKPLMLPLRLHEKPLKTLPLLLP